jgi:putative transposase
MVKVLEGQFGGQGDLSVGLDDLAREGARRMLVAALETEVVEYLAWHRGERDDRGHAKVVRNGRARRGR